MMSLRRFGGWDDLTNDAHEETYNHCKLPRLSTASDGKVSPDLAVLKIAKKGDRKVNLSCLTKTKIAKMWGIWLQILQDIFDEIYKNKLMVTNDVFNKSVLENERQKIKWSQRIRGLKSSRTENYEIKADVLPKRKKGGFAIPKIVNY